MKSHVSLLLTLVLIFPIIATPSFAKPRTIESTIINNAGTEIGSVQLTQGTKGVVVTVQVKDLTPGYHGMHFHAIGDCSDREKFKSAAGHVDPFKKPHGFLNPKGPHEGNLPNLIVAKDGTAHVELYTELVSLSEGPSNLLDSDGSALIIHVNKDDHTSQPIGGSGGRVACAEIK